MSNIKYYAEDVDINDFIPIQEPMSDRNKMTVSIGEKGYITICGVFLKELKSLNIKFLVNEDMSKIIIKEMDENDKCEYKFPKNGRKKDVDFQEKLKKSNYEFPVKYEMYFYEKDQLWVGEYVKNKKSKLEKEVKKIVKRHSKDN